MSVIIFANNATTTLAAPISAGSTTISVAPGTGALFPSPSAGQYFTLTLLDAATQLVREIVFVTNRSTDTMTVTRAQEGTTAHSWLAGDYASNDWTAGGASAMVQVAQLQAQTTNFASATGTNTITASLTPAPVSYASIEGSAIRIQAAGANTGSATLNLNGLGAVTIVNPNGSNLTGGQIPGAGAMIEVTYDGAHFQLISSALSLENFGASFSGTNGSLTLPNGVIFQMFTVAAPFSPSTVTTTNFSLPVSYVTVQFNAIGGWFGTNPPTENSLAVQVVDKATVAVTIATTASSGTSTNAVTIWSIGI